MVEKPHRVISIDILYVCMYLSRSVWVRICLINYTQHTIPKGVNTSWVLNFVWQVKNKGYIRYFKSDLGGMKSVELMKQIDLDLTSK